MQKKFDLSPDDLIALEPPDEAMTEGTEPFDKPIRRHESFSFLITVVLLLLPRGIPLWRIGIEAKFFSESELLPYLEQLLNWQLFAVIISSLFLIFMAYKLLFPLRFSLIRIGFIATIFQLAYEYFRTP